MTMNQYGAFVFVFLEIKESCSSYATRSIETPSYPKQCVVNLTNPTTNTSLPTFCVIDSHKYHYTEQSVFIFPFQPYELGGKQYVR